MSVVAGTPVIDSPSAAVTISCPSMVTRRMTALTSCLLHDVPGDGDDGLGLITRRARHRRRLPQRCGEGGSGRGGRQRAAGKREAHRHRGPTGEWCGQASIGALNAHGDLLLFDERHGLGPLPRPDDHTMASPLDLGYILPHSQHP